MAKIIDKSKYEKVKYTPRISAPHEPYVANKFMHKHLGSSIKNKAENILKTSFPNSNLLNDVLCAEL